MFKLTIAFATLAELSAFVTRMGGSVQGGTIEHSQTIEGDTTAATPTAKTPAQKAAETRAAKKAAAEAEAAKTAAPDTIGANVGATPFAAPTNFAPGMEQPAQPVHHAPAAAINAGPVHAPMAPAQATTPAPAPAPAPVVPAAQPMNTVAPAQPAPVSPQRQQWNDACVALVNQLGSLGLPDAQLAKTMQDSFAEAGCPAGSRIGSITDQQITQFYPILNRNVNALAAAKAAGQFV